MDKFMKVFLIIIACVIGLGTALLYLLHYFFFDSAKRPELDQKELVELMDDELCEAVFFRIYDKMDDDSENLDLVSEPEKKVYTVLEYMYEIDNGGICQYLTNTMGQRNSLLIQYLEELGAKKNAKLFQELIDNNKIDYQMLDKIDSEEGYAKADKEYSFDKYDEEYGSIQEEEDILAICAEYIRKHINEVS